MRTPFLARLKPFVLSVAVITIVTIGHSETRADEVFVAGYTNGCFDTTSTPCTPPDSGGAAQSTSLLGLTFYNSTFSGTTAGGLKPFGGNPLQGLNLNNFGALNLTTAPNNYNGAFTLQITFTDPQGIAGSNSSLFTATVTGTVVSDEIGGVTVDFDNTPILFTFIDTNCGVTTIPGQQTTCGSGQFFLTLNDVDIDPGQTAPISGRISGAQQTAIPEPATMLLLGTGLAGVAAAARRRRKARSK